MASGCNLPLNLANMAVAGSPGMTRGSTKFTVMEAQAAKA
jgi:hypothetical protein